MSHLTITKELAIITLITLTLSLIVNCFHPKGLNLTDPFVVKIQNDDVPEFSSGPQRIDINEAADCFHKKDYLFIDARSKADFLSGHIKNAINLPEHRLDMYLDAFMAQTSPQIKIITYCGSADCPLGAHLAEKLYYMGFEQVYYLAGGLDAWRDKNLPVKLK